KEKTNYFYVFGGRDERSQDLIQGITLAGVLFDEVALMPESFVNQATGRCSVTGSKFWFNCNPDNPSHWFKKNWVDKAKDKKLLYLHFTMDDNLS
ncbi:PBSX family phage terminase large subunit, partial [Klebsiella pneumoniae]|nr:PBSX family phage terminase large subunit [Klebsiella pneumoniae]